MTLGNLKKSDPKSALKCNVSIEQQSFQHGIAKRSRRIDRYFVAGASGRLCGLDIPADDATGRLRDDNRTHHFGSVRNSTGRHSDRIGNFLSQPHTQWYHLAC